VVNRESIARTLSAWLPPRSSQRFANMVTVGLEFEEQAPHLDSLLVAVGGGGLIGGMAAFAPLLSAGYCPSPGERVGVLLCGANTTAVDFGNRIPSAI
jgi:hypothetical protein